jgi:hypothetical protein
VPEIELARVFTFDSEQYDDLKVYNVALQESDQLIQ